ncbi:hypothetical protein SDC9_202268 [bioreactor metagenome]|uniref:Uncharacterized protein n=1 Tax=bioreactor metagenome TaxID=1076179 RepID=A0A645ITW1_9ZZZZ
MRILHEVDRREHTERNRDQEREQRHKNGIEQRGKQGEVLRVVFPLKELEREMRNTFYEDIANHEQQRANGNERREMNRESKEKSRDLLSFHCCFLRFVKEKRKLMIKMKIKSTTPVAINASRCRSAE